MADTKALVAALGIASSAIATEHFFTFSLSSLPTTKKFFQDEEGKEEVRHAYMIATALSIGLSLIIAYYLQSVVPVVVTIVLSIIFIWLYERALGGKV